MQQPASPSPLNTRRWLMVCSAGELDEWHEAVDHRACLVASDLISWHEQFLRGDHPRSATDIMQTSIPHV
ncbi:hypothetical protein ASPCADRAFT_207965 [Aspergillus carbonarius ITEM 5010]|uniref:Uncharacterized protein n=1 Tax=Aspergillus carbonarius (strain ITEM 5010) TaxID=602072 RepID=A0A1R3RLY7_ASPC5|nr:hypothetical protein ASPCADRAFT_207965 [Aspergillus carbonarius ITEM 5010]